MNKLTSKPNKYYWSLITKFMTYKKNIDRYMNSRNQIFD